MMYRMLARPDSNNWKGAVYWVSRPGGTEIAEHLLPIWSRALKSEMKMLHALAVAAEAEIAGLIAMYPDSGRDSPNFAKVG